MKVKEGLTACVDFATGAVSFIGYKIAGTDLTHHRLGVRPGFIVTMVRIDWVDVSVLLKWEQTIPGLYLLRGLPEGTCIYVALSRTAPKERRLCTVIQALKAEGYLSRHQELAAYVELGIPYSEG